MTQNLFAIAEDLLPLACRVLRPECDTVVVGPGPITGDPFYLGIVLSYVRGGRVRHVPIYTPIEIDDGLHQEDAGLRFEAVRAHLNETDDVIRAEIRRAVDHFWRKRRESFPMPLVLFYCGSHGGHVAMTERLVVPNQAVLGAQLEICRACATRQAAALTGRGAIGSVNPPVHAGEAELRKQASCHLVLIQARLDAITGDSGFLENQLDPARLIDRLAMVAARLGKIADDIKVMRPPRGLRRRSAKEPLERLKGPAGSRWS